MKWFFYAIVFIYMLYRAVYGAKSEVGSVSVEAINYGKSQFWKTGSNHTVNCYISNVHQEVEWKTPSEVKVSSDPNSRIFMRKNVARFRGRSPSLVLNLRNVTVDDSGFYACESGSSSDEALVCVIEPLEFLHTLTEVTVDRNRSITLSCQVKGAPEPTITWQRNGEDINDEAEDSKYKVSTKYNVEGLEGLLTIVSLDPEDSGVYTCVGVQDAFGCHHSDEKNITLHVNHAPIFENDEDTEEVYGDINQSVSIECSASAYPAPTYSWFRDDGDNGLFAFNEKHVVFNEEENKAILVIIADSTTYGETFKCQASNLYGDTEKNFVLLKMEKPKRPSKVLPYNCNENQIQYKVKWYDDIHFPVDGFDIQYLSVSEAKRGRNPPKFDVDWKNRKQTQAEVVDKDNDELDKTVMLVTLPNLEEETEYWVRLRPRNIAGESTWSDPVLAATKSKPEEEATTTTDDSPTEATIVYAETNSVGTVFGIFFAGGILVVAFVCMVAMRMV